MASRSGKPTSFTAPRWRGAVLAFALALASVAAGARAEEFLWPLPDAPRAMTGTFMEFRQGRYHSGLDLRTQGREGLRVVAPASGSVVRLRSSARGYGIAVYLRLPDGRELVFAHLSALADRLRAPLLAAWSATGRYEQDLALHRNAIEVERGELLALSGSTGVGAPHLHLELRDGRERPLNPLLHGFSLPDSVAPRILAVRLVPLSAGSTVDGGREARVLTPGASAAVAGSLGVMVEVADRSGFSPFRLGPAEVGVELSGKEIYRLREDTFAFSQTGQMRLERAVDPRDPARTWLRLYRRPGNDLPGREAKGPAGMSFSLPRGEEATLRVWARDAAGNDGSAVFPLKGAEPAPPRAEETGRWVPYAREGQAPARGVQTLTGGVATQRRLRWALGPRDSLFLADPKGDALYPGGEVWLEPATGRLDRAEGMHLEGSACALNAAGAVFRDGLGLTVTTSRLEGAGKRALFSYAPKHGWSYVAGPFDSTGTIHGTLDEPGLLALARDRAAPALGKFRSRDRVLRAHAVLVADEQTPRHALAGLTLPRWPAVSLTVADAGAGVSDEGPVTLLDGKPYPARWDPEGERVVYEFWLDPGPGTHSLTVRAEDRLGNRSEREIRLDFASPDPKN